MTFINLSKINQTCIVAYTLYMLDEKFRFGFLFLQISWAFIDDTKFDRLNSLIKAHVKS